MKELKANLKIYEEANAMKKQMMKMFNAAQALAYPVLFGNIFAIHDMELQRTHNNLMESTEKLSEEEMNEIREEHILQDAKEAERNA